MTLMCQTIVTAPNRKKERKIKLDQPPSQAPQYL